MDTGEYRTYFKLDRDAKYFSFDADGDQNNPIKNYKKVGNKETFDVYAEDMNDQFIAKVELTLDPDLANTKITTVDQLAKQQIKDGASKLLNKGKDLIQNQKEKREAKKQEKAEANNE